MGLFGLLSIFDWITPIVETTKDISYTVGSGEIGTPLAIDKDELRRASRILQDAGYTVISTTTESFHNEGYLDVPQAQAQAARALLSEYGIMAI